MIMLQNDDVNVVTTLELGIKKACIEKYYGVAFYTLLLKDDLKTYKRL